MERFPGQTPLTSAGVGQGQHEWLGSLWIESIEEAIAAYAALGSDEDLSDEVRGLKVFIESPSTLNAVSPERLGQIRSCRQGGVLGCLVDEQNIKEFERIGQMRPARAAPSGAFAPDLPREVSLIDRMAPHVRNQGQRGTCVAFASVALREFLLPARMNLSEQFLYWACKELDGHPGPGTYIHTSMNALALYGVCEEESWPYNPGHVPGKTEGQGPPPDGAKENAKHFCLNAARTVEPNLVEHYKHVLAGKDGQGGMPIAFGTLVFNSWYRSAETHRTGKITLPLPGETHQGGHAWCVVGYKDDQDVPGGGYFIVRNSWGPEWASESPVRPGHALMPYAYVERYALEAYTGPAELESMTVQSEEELQWRPFIRILERSERDADDRLLKAGTPVLFHPASPGAFHEDTPANRQEFLRRDRTWTPQDRQAAWFPPLSSLPGDLSGRLDHYRAARNGFLTAIAENMRTAPGMVLPDSLAPSLWSRLLAWKPTVRDARQVADLGPELARRMAMSSGVPPEIGWPDDWRQWLESLNGMVVHALHCGKTVVHVVSAVLTRVNFSTPGQVDPVPPGQDAIDMVRQIHAQWLKNNGQPGSFVMYTIGSMLPWSGALQGHAGGNAWLLVSTLGDDGGWQTALPPSFAADQSFRDFMDLLRPETRQQRVFVIKDYVDARLEEGYEGNLHLDKIAKATGRRRSVILDAFRALHDSGRYRLYRTPEGQIAVGHASSKMGETITEIDYLEV